MSGSTPFTNDDVDQILRVVDRLSDVEIRLESGDIKLHVRKSSAAGAVAQIPSQGKSSPEAIRQQPQERIPQSLPISTSSGKEVSLLPGTVAIRAPMLGAFYRSPSPAEPPFVEIGKQVSVNDPVCLIEIMKLFNTVNSGVNGTIISINVENGAMVAENHILFVVKVD